MATKPYTRYHKAHINVTLNPEHVTQLDEIALAKQSSRSQVVREAVVFYLRENRTERPSTPMYHADVPEGQAA